MSNVIETLFKDKAKTIKVFLKTVTKAVYDEEGNRLDNVLTEMKEDITTLNNNLTEKWTTKKVTFTTPAISASYVGSVDVDVTLDGYAPLGIIQQSHYYSSEVAVTEQYLKSSNVFHLTLRNLTSSAVSSNANNYIVVLYEKA